MHFKKKLRIIKEKDPILHSSSDLQAGFIVSGVIFKGVSKFYKSYLARWCCSDMVQLGALPSSCVRVILTHQGFL